MPAVTHRHREEEDLPPLLVWGGGLLLLAVVCFLFYAIWRTQFTRSAGYLFDTSSASVEAGYCLNVAQMIVPGGAPIASYFDEAAQFWTARLRKIDPEGMARAIIAGQVKLMADKTAAGPKSNVWFQYAMDQCSNRAVNYGFHFRSFD